VLQLLLERQYRGQFTVEYEGHCDGTLRLYQSVQRARTIVEALQGRRTSAGGNA